MEVKAKRTVTTARYSNGNWDVALNWRHLPPVRNSLYVTDPLTTVRGAGEYNVFGLTGNWELSKVWALTLGIDNLFDRQPERVGAGQIQTIAAQNAEVFGNYAPQSPDQKKDQKKSQAVQ